MVWFQCDECGEEVKKPKLRLHFRICSARKLSCIDCGQTFWRDTAKDHKQCITEAEKYGPKDQNKSSNGTMPEPKGDSDEKPDLDIYVGLSECPVWFCRLCKVRATSKQTLYLHAEGRKHKAKARAFLAAAKESEQTECTQNADVPAEVCPKHILFGDQNNEERIDQDQPTVAPVLESPEMEDGTSRKKRKLCPTENNVPSGASEEDERNSDDAKKKIKWNKLITSALKSNPEGTLKMRKLRKRVLEAIQKSGTVGDESELYDILECKIKSSSRFNIDGKYVRLVTKDSN